MTENQRFAKGVTVMCFFAGDVNTSPGMIAQLKAIKDAGFQENTTVLVRYDANEVGTQPRIFEVNRERKRNRYEPATMIGDGRDPFVRSLEDDEVILSVPKSARKPTGKRQLSQAGQALKDFLDHTLATTERAGHYMLFLIGHGTVVGNDTFLPDDSAASAITLRELGCILRRFSADVKGDGDGKSRGSAFQLVGMHSCSLSAVEVAYELQDTANYMMATEGASFVGSWPYRQLLKKVFNTVDRKGGTLTGKDVQRLLKKLHFLCLHNARDFQFAGFSADICLCSLASDKVGEKLNGPIRNLTRALKEGLAAESEQTAERARECILLAHWRAQSYWQDNYTDLSDFCRCLSEKCDGEDDWQKNIREACRVVIEALTKKDESARGLEAFKNLIVCSDHFGPTYQYSHGLSIYFPWSRPVEDTVEGAREARRLRDADRKADGGVYRPDTVLGRYAGYRFTQELEEQEKDSSWLTFLEEYFDRTRRESREAEDGRRPVTAASRGGRRRGGAVAVGPGVPAVAVVVSNTAEELPEPPKPNPALGGVGSAGGCRCGSVKNYPTEFSESPAASEAAERKEERRLTR
ncbi:MAG TPA: clostripain-related cysteine peptidase [Pyrinomonadaceae bacterium]|nr:clostripain-related cysteine peptidase [Pyrinomonadaceae bacterium]